MTQGEKNKSKNQQETAVVKMSTAISYLEWTILMKHFFLSNKTICILSKTISFQTVQVLLISGYLEAVTF